MPASSFIKSGARGGVPMKKTLLVANLGILGLDVGTCTLAIVMVRDFPNPASLPGGLKTGPPSDFSTWIALWKVADNLVKQCVQRQGEMGWQQAGMEYFHLFSFLLHALNMSTSWVMILGGLEPKPRSLANSDTFFG